MKRLLVALAMACCLPVWGDGGGRLESVRADADFALTADAGAAQWAAVPGVTFAAGPMGQPEPKHRTEVRSRWTNDYLYVLFVCPYEQLYLKPAPDTVQETNKLWEYDVAEVFVGADFDAIHRYREFQVSPRGEWVDLDIDRQKADFADSGWKWNSRFQVKARIDAGRKIWYGEMKIPYRTIDSQGPAAGRELRINFYRIQGPPEKKVHVAWQPTGQRTYHVPEAFGRLILR